MGYTSKLYPGEVVVTESNALDHCQPIQGGQRRFFGRVPRPKGIEYSCEKPFSDLGIDIVPVSEYDDRIKEMEDTQTRISDLLLQSNIPSLDQNGTNYCWCNAVTGAVQAIRAQQNQAFVKLSPASVAAPLKNYSNQGGWGAEALDYMVANGIASVDQWPANAISKQYYAASRDNAALHKVSEFVKLNSRDFSQLMSLLFARIPTAIGLNWWSHEVLACDPVALGSGQYGVRFRNSWSDTYGTKGFNTLTQAKATPDDACSPTVTIASNN